MSCSLAARKTLMPARTCNPQPEPRVAPGVQASLVARESAITSTRTEETGRSPTRHTQPQHAHAQPQPDAGEQTATGGGRTGRRDGGHGRDRVCIR